MLETLRRIPFFVPLISIFFVLHGVLENFGFIPAKDAFVLLIIYLGGTVLVAAIAWLLLRNRRRAAILTGAILAFFFFYEAFIQWMTTHFPHRSFTNSPFLLAFGLVLLIAVFFFILKNKRSFSRLYLFLNVLLLLYVVTDTGWLIFKVLHPPVNPLSVYSFAKDETAPPCTSCAKPDVYFLLFDEYGGSLALREQYHFDNSCLDTFLVKQGFHINRRSRSNYCLTVFSMASALNMSYIRGIKDPLRISSQDYMNAYQLIRDNRVVSVFSREGYVIKNFSIFDLAGHPTSAWQSFLPLKTRLITARTLTGRLERHWNTLVTKYLEIKRFVVQDYMKYAASNEQFLEQTASEADRKDGRPKFIYAHFMMPHFPYLFDSLGHRKSDGEIYNERYANPPGAYFSYLQYTNRRLEPILENIRRHDPGAVILLCGDHGYRERAMEQNPGLPFHNLNAVYFPDQDYSRWNDSISLVNQFRIVFDQLFHAGYPMLKDSTIPLRE